ncbi:MULTISPECIES: GntR family transcriptional regulator [Paraliobacillus]|uniref:GntR family transcriptional regulator n=1 Tax=Paraliobacillus TaxID=200903 RepID=UPI000DD3AA8E|nr:MULTISPECIES: GntR family transcriptional regulator [Paraliobacillus]
MIDKNSPVPIYHQLEQHIKQLIEKGDLKPGDMIPSEREYADKYNVSRMTIRQAIVNLVNERYLYRVKGKGTFIKEKKLEQSLQGLTSFSEDMKSRGMKASSKLISFEIIPADSKLANQLGIQEHGPVYEIKRIRLAEEEPMALERTYISANKVKGLTEEIVQQSLYEYMEEKLLLKIAKGTQEIEAAIVNNEEVEYLKIPEHSPIMLIQRATSLEDGTIVEVVKSSYRADRYKFMIELTRL